MQTAAERKRTMAFASLKLPTCSWPFFVAISVLVRTIAANRILPRAHSGTGTSGQAFVVPGTAGNFGGFREKHANALRETAHRGSRVLRPKQHRYRPCETGALC